MTGRLQDRIALITGSDSGIGQGTAIEFATEGAEVVMHYLRDADGAQQTRDAVEAKAAAVVMQPTSPTSTRSAGSSTKSRRSAAWTS